MSHSSRFIPLTIALFLLFFGLLGAFSFVDSRGLFKVQYLEVELESSQFADSTSEFLRQQLLDQMNQLRGHSLWSLSLNKVHKNLSEYEWLESIHVQRSWPNKIRVRAQVKTVAFLLMNEKGIISAVFDDAFVSNQISYEHLPSLPVARDVWFFDDKSLREDAIRLLSALPKEGALSLQTVSDMSWAAYDGFSLQLTFGRTKVLIGNDNFAKKMNRVSQVIEYLDSKKQTGRVIDAAYSQKVLVRLRNRP